MDKFFGLDYKREKDYLICLDSDGCVMDTMDIKHKKCFYEEALKVWELYEIKDEFYDVWCDINLYSESRGINRFLGLVKAFEILERKGFKVPDYLDLKEWIDGSDKLSNKSLEEMFKLKKSLILEKTLIWSQQVNESIDKLELKDNAFYNAKEAIKEIKDVADIIVVSSANKEALLAEWEYSELLGYPKLILTQENGSKEEILKKIRELGYDQKKILMVGDSPGDLNAAIKNDVSFYPILVKYEEESWERFKSEVSRVFLAEKYQGVYQDEINNKFLKNLGMGV